MAVSVIPQLIDALIAAGQAAGVNTYDGVSVTESPADYLMVGVDDVEGDDPSRAASSQQEWAHANRTTRDEQGTVTCAAFSWNGAGDQKACRDAAYVMVEALASACRANPTLDIPNLLWTSFGGDADLSQAQGESGASALVIFTIGFRARI